MDPMNSDANGVKETVITPHDLSQQLWKLFLSFTWHTMSHLQAVSLMTVVTLLWSMAGVVTRHLDSAASFEVTFWRSAFKALALIVRYNAPLMIRLYIFWISFWAN